MTMVCDDAIQETDLPDLIPARMLNEFAYCPRLAYLEWVQGEFVDNLETIEGRFGHRRVDRPTCGDVPEPEAPEPAASGRQAAPVNGSESENERANGDSPSTGTAPRNTVPRSTAPRDTEPPTTEPIHTRSLMLSSAAEGLIAKMDLVDISSAEAVPVDYKRGRVPDLPEGAWEPERVQLCAQGLVLRDNGYACDSGILYFIESKRRVSIPFDDQLVARTRELIQQMREMAAAGKIPRPLDDSPKCPRCSLVGICLPDETTLLNRCAGTATAHEHDDKEEKGEAAKRGDAAKQGEVRRLMPARDDALPLYIQDQGVTLGKTGEQLSVKRRGETLRKVKLLDVSQVCLFGNVQVTAQALREITARGIPVCHFSYGGWFHAVTSGLTNKNIELRLAQFATAANASASLGFARAFIVGKIKNCRTLLRRHLKNDPDGLLRQLARLASKAERASAAATLLGIEGTAARLYFAGLAQLFKGHLDFQFDGRNRRPPRDPVNAMLSFVYAMLTKELTVTVMACGFDPMLGFFHRPRYGRPSLALDLAEEFRPLIADSVVLTLINNGEVAPADFIRRAGGVALTKAGRRAVIAAFERRMDSLVTHPIFGYRISYRRILEVQTRLLARCVLGEIEQYPNFCTR